MELKRRAADVGVEVQSVTYCGFEPSKELAAMVRWGGGGAINGRGGGETLVVRACAWAGAAFRWMGEGNAAQEMCGGRRNERARDVGRGKTGGGKMADGAKAEGPGREGEVAEGGDRAPLARAEALEHERQLVPVRQEAHPTGIRRASRCGLGGV